MQLRMEAFRTGEPEERPTLHEQNVTEGFFINQRTMSYEWRIQMPEGNLPAAKIRLSLRFNGQQLFRSFRTEQIEKVDAGPPKVSSRFCSFCMIRCAYS